MTAPRLSPESDAYLAGLLAAVEALGIEVRERIDYRTAADLGIVEWLDAVSTLGDVADDLRRWVDQTLHAATGDAIPDRDIHADLLGAT